MLRSLYRDPREYLSHVMKVTNMSCLTPEGALSGDCDFLSANMYARSLFGVYRLATVVRFVSQQGVRRGRIGQLEYRENRTWEHHWSCADTKQNAGHCFIFGRSHYNISKGRKASCLMGCVDTYEYYTIDQMCTSFITRSRSGHPVGAFSRLPLSRRLDNDRAFRFPIVITYCPGARWQKLKITNLCS